MGEFCCWLWPLNPTGVTMLLSLPMSIESNVTTFSNVILISIQGGLTTFIVLIILSTNHKNAMPLAANLQSTAEHLANTQPLNSWIELWLWTSLLSLYIPYGNRIMINWPFLGLCILFASHHWHFQMSFNVSMHSHGLNKISMSFLLTFKTVIAASDWALLNPC